MPAKTKTLFDTLRHDYPSFRDAKVEARLVWMMLLLTIKLKYQTISLIRERKTKGKENVIVKLDNKCDLPPPPPLLFPRIVEIFRWIGQNAIAEKRKSCFQYFYSDDGRKEIINWQIDYGVKKDPAAELGRIMTRFCKMERAKEKVEKIKRR